MARDIQDASILKLPHSIRAHTTLLLLALPAYTVHFKSPTYLQSYNLDLLDKKACKEILKASASNAEVRRVIGGDVRYWAEMVECLRAGVGGCERRSFAGGTAADAGIGVDYEATRGALIASHYPGLWRDLERLNDLISIARNVLTIGPRAQDLAAEHALEHEVFRLINCCVRVTARGYDGDAGTGEEEKWQWVVNAYKKLLITSLQWLNNFIAGNERRKVGVWVGLFDNATDSDAPGMERGSSEESQQIAEASKPEPPAKTKPSPPITAHDILLAYGTNGSSRISPLEMEGAIPLYPSAQPSAANPPSSLTGFNTLPSQISTLVKKNHFDPNGYVYFTAQYRATAVEIYQRDHKRSPTLAEIHRAIPSLWEEERKKAGKSEKKMWEYWQGAYDRAVRDYRNDLERFERGKDPVKKIEEKKDAKAEEIDKADKAKEARIVEIEEKLRALEEELRERYQAVSDMTKVTSSADVENDTGVGSLEREAGKTARLLMDPGFNAGNRDDTRMHFSAEAGAKILESGKAELMKRLEGYAEEDELEAAAAAGDARAEDQIAAARSRRKSRRRSRQSLSEAFATGDSLASEDEQEMNGEEEDEGDDSDEDDDEEEEDYPGSSEDGRGLLTDVPLILGPSEIEVLPMLVMSGIVSSYASEEPKGLSVNELEIDTSKSASALTTHLLLTRTSGRNLLRELLIFVAAWDLREEELYFKFMVKITEQILSAGLMPYAYHSFRDRSRSKDIISPAQAVIMKLLTTIFRARGKERFEATRPLRKGGSGGVKWEEFRDGGKVLKRGTVDGSPWEELLTDIDGNAKPDSIVAPEPRKVIDRAELHVVNFVFTEFRQHIIPQTCALIFLQGQIHRGKAGAEDFPLNLWDMERMYEGVYQFLEFFAGLAEEQPKPGGEPGEQQVIDPGSDGAEEAGLVCWKKILAEWEMASELVTLLRELESGIPKLMSGGRQMLPGGLQSLSQRNVDRIKPAPPQRSLSADAATLPTKQSAVSIERPFEMDDSTLTAHSRSFEVETSLAYPEDQHGSIVPPASSIMHDQDEPSDFEWRNLKKLTVLVLSSLIWKNKAVQDQVRRCGGLEALVGCCKPDEHNPYIREHAIMCLRFAVEGNEDNADVIRKMAGLDKDNKLLSDSLPPTWRSVPKEVLDTRGYETFMDSKGQVGLRAKELPGTYAAERSATGDNGKMGIMAVAFPPSTSQSLPSGGLPAGAAGGKAKVSAASTTKMTAEKAAELMQNALRDLPLGDKLVTDRQKAEALARLDRAFESTEKALGKSISGEGGSKG